MKLCNDLPSIVSAEQDMFDVLVMTMRDVILT